MIKLKKGKDKYYLPTQASELTFADYIRLIEWQENGGGDLQFIMALADCSRQIALDCADKWERINFIELQNEIAQLPAMEAAKQITVLGSPVKVKDFYRMNVGQRLAMQLSLKEVEKTYQALAKIVAIGVAPDVFGKDDWADYLDLIEEDVLLMPAVEAIPVAFFLLNHLTIMKPGGTALSGLKVLNLFRLEVMRWVSMVFSR